MKNIITLLLFIGTTSYAWAQQYNLSGQIANKQGELLQHGTVKLLPSSIGAAIQQDGKFELLDVPSGRYVLEVSAMGYEPLNKEIVITESQHISLRLEQNNSLDEVMVYGHTQTDEANRQSYNITAIDAKKMYNTTLDISHALDRVSGVRVREDGGVGSRINFSLNGFTGRQVRFFIDGVPMENFGPAFQINNIPINLAERVEVYKGVVPVWLGSDALGGAVNIVTSNKARTYLDASYSFGSFNTHRTVVNAGFTSKSGFTAQINAFQNYSDNNYWVNVDVADINTGQYFRDQRVRRFNDNYHNETIVANVGVVGKKFADQLLIGLTAGQYYREIQTGARLVSVFGDYHTHGNILMPHIKYQKDNLFLKGLNIRLTANYNLGQEQVVDTVYRRYNWFQDYKEYAGEGGERSLSLYKYGNNNGLATANVTYNFGKGHSLMFNNVFSTFNRKGSDELFPEAEKYERPQLLTKNVLALGYKYDLNEKWSTSLFAKQFLQATRYSVSYQPNGVWGSTAFRNEENRFSSTGYGIASSYFVLPSLQLKASYERSFRLPDTYEIFGDLINLEGNSSLRPEKSDNYNFGFSAQFKPEHNHRIHLASNLIYRHVRDFIRPALNNNQTKQIMENRDLVTNMGIDGELRYSFKRMLTAGVNLTYQNLRNKTEFEPGSNLPSLLYNDRIPNMPFLYGNADASLFLHDVFGKSNTLSIGYNMLYVHAYYLYWPSMGKDKLDIPQQITHDINMVYALKDGRYNIGLECRNLLDSKLYDNFSLQKPGRSFNIKLRYFISKNNK